MLYGSYGLDQCLDLVERAMRAAAPNNTFSPDWLIGDGIALTMIDTVPPAGHLADATISLRDDGGFELTVGTAEFGNGTSTVHRQIAATALATTVDRINLRQSDTAHGGHDTGRSDCRVSRSLGQRDPRYRRDALRQRQVVSAADDQQ